jgi:hypothetical protein
VAASVIGTVKSGNTKKSFQVKWDASGKEVYVSYAGWTRAGTASSAGDAMRTAEAFLYNK